jgi:hypothetical protein
VLGSRGGPRRPPRIDEEHEREQSRHFTVVGQHPPHYPEQPHRLIRQLGALQVVAAAPDVALVEDQIQHVQHLAQSGRPLFAAGDPERHTRRLDALLRSSDALRHRRLRHEEGAGDLGRAQPADRP